MNFNEIVDLPGHDQDRNNFEISEKSKNGELGGGIRVCPVSNDEENSKYYKGYVSDDIGVGIFEGLILLLVHSRIL